MAAQPNLAVLWDVHHPYRMGETPRQTFETLKNGELVKHVHIKDALRVGPGGEWRLTLLEEGQLPVAEVVGLLAQGGYSGYLSLEWEKKWHSEIEEPEIALPHFATILRKYIAETPVSN